MVSGYNEARKKIIKALQNQNYQHEIRATINEKNLLSTGEVTPDEVIRLIGKSSGINHTMSMHHQIKSLQVHLIKIDGWYIKFYFIDPNAIFISVHK